MPLAVIDPMTFKRIEQYAFEHHISVDLAVSEVVSDWLDLRVGTEAIPDAPEMTVTN